MNDQTDIAKLLQTMPWDSLFDRCATRSARRWKIAACGKDTAPSTSPPSRSPWTKLTVDGKKLAHDIIANLYCQLKQRQEQLKWSVRRIEKARQELLSNSLILEFWLGKSLFLVPTATLYVLMELESPYVRNVSAIHSFSILLAAHLILYNPLVQKIKCEVTLGDSNSTVDVVAYLHNSLRWAYEITLSASNVSANAAKLENKGFAQIYFVCRDYNLKEAVWAHLRNAGFPTDYLASIRCVIFSTLLRQKKQMTPRS